MSDNANGLEPLLAVQNAASDRGSLPGRPIFIVGCPRSGTTLLATLFDRHSQLAVPPETHFFMHFRGQLPRRTKVFSTPDLAAAFVEDLYASDLGLDPQAIIRRVASTTVSLPRFFDAALQEFAAARGKSGWAEKTPEHLFFVDEILTWYPNARFVCIMRDGRDATMSMDALPWSLTPSRGHAAIWRESAQYARRWSRQFPETFFIIRFEDLLADPPGVLAEAMGRVGLVFEPEQLTVSRSTGVVPDWETEVKRNVVSELDPTRAYAWKKTAKPHLVQIMNSMMSAELQAFGYPHSEVPSSSRPSAAYDWLMNWTFSVLFGVRMANCRRFVRRILSGLVRASPHAPFRKMAKKASAVDDGRE